MMNFNAKAQSRKGVKFFHFIDSSFAFFAPRRLCVKLCHANRQTIGGDFGLEEIFTLARAGRGVFSRGLHVPTLSSGGAADFWLRVWPRQTDGSTDRPAGVLFRAGDRLPLLRAATLFLLAHLQRPVAAALAGAGILGRAVCGDCLRLRAALGQSQNRVADSDCLDRPRILPQRTLLLEILVD